LVKAEQIGPMALMCSHRARIETRLGNPGAQYAGNRHNIGFMAVDAIQRRHSFSPWAKKFKAEISEGTLAGEKVMLIKPQTFMNLSGESVGEAMRFYKLSPADINVIHDELDLPPGGIRLKQGGGNGGHNGLKDIQARLGTPDFWRLRIGIGHPRTLQLNQMVVDFVLHRPGREHQEAIDDEIDRALACLPDEVLRRVAARMLAAVREVDTVSRHGGDEFVILLAELAQPADVRRVVDKLLETLRSPITVAGRVLRISASVGVAVYPEDGEQLATLVEHADAAMYEAKRGAAHAQQATRAVHLSAPVWGPGPTPAAAPTTDPRDAQHHDPEYRFRQMREANEQLVLAALSARELQVAAEQAQRRQVAFVAAAADELRNPMAPIRIASGMLGRQQAEQPMLGRVQSIVEQQLARMSRLLGHVIAASGSNGTPALHIELKAVDPVALVDEVVAAFQPLARRQHKQLDWQPPDQEWRVQGDPALLVQVVDNLLDNAVRFTHEGGHIEVALDLDAQGEWLRLTVADDGIGITAPVLPHVFEPFVQDIRALGLHAAGIGIGLTVARELVRAHRGDIMAFSGGASRGSRFVVTLPVLRGADLTAAAAAAGAA
jgi:aminoacyl-tRNA hydrolase